MRTFGVITIVNGVVATLAACAVWAVAGLWGLIPVFIVLGGVVCALGRQIVKRADDR